MRCQFDNVHDLLGRCVEAGPCHLFHLLTQVVLVCSLECAVVEADQRGVEIEVGVDGHGISYVLRETKALGQEHEGAGQQVVQFSVPVPVFSVLVILRAVVGLGAMDVLHDLVEQVAIHRSPGERGVGGPGEDILEPAGSLLLARIECFFGAGKMRCDLVPAVSRGLLRVTSRYRGRLTSSRSIRVGQPVEMAP